MIMKIVIYFIWCILLCTPMVAAQGGEDLILWLSLNESAPIQQDQSLYEQNCTVENGAFVEGIDGGSFGFNGLGHIRCEPSPSLANVLRGPFTFLFWARIDAVSSADDWGSKGNFFRMTSTSAFSGNLKVVTDYGNSGQNRTSAQGLFAPGSWRHIVITSTGQPNLDGSQMTISLNGLVQEITTYSGTSAIQDQSDELAPLWIGGNLHGALDHIKLYNRVLSSEEIQMAAQEFEIPMPTATPVPEPTAVPTATPIPEPTATPTAVPTLVPTPTPMPQDGCAFEISWADVPGSEPVLLQRLNCTNTIGWSTIFQESFTLMFWTQAEDAPFVPVKSSTIAKIGTQDPTKRAIGVRVDFGTAGNNTATFAAEPSSTDWRHIAIFSTGLTNEDGKQLHLFVNGVHQSPNLVSGYSGTDFSGAEKMFTLDGSFSTVYCGIDVVRGVVSEQELLTIVNEGPPTTTTTTSTSTTTTSSTTTTTTTNTTSSTTTSTTTTTTVPTTTSTTTSTTSTTTSEPTTTTTTSTSTTTTSTTAPTTTSSTTTTTTTSTTTTSTTANTTTTTVPEERVIRLRIDATIRILGPDE